MTCHPAMVRLQAADFAARVPGYERAIDAALKLRTPAEREKALTTIVYAGTRDERFLAVQLLIARLSGMRTDV